MAQLINTYIEDAKPGMYVCYPCENTFGVDLVYAPREYQRAVKVIIYCYDDGSIVRKGIGEEVYEGFESFRGDDMIGCLHSGVSCLDTIKSVNCCLLDSSMSDILEEIDHDMFTIAEPHLSLYFKKFVEYLKTWDIHQAPKPWREYGFLYYHVEPDDEEPYYEIAGVTRKDKHCELKGNFVR